MTEEAERLITTIRQMQAALTDDKPNPNYGPDDGLEVTYPLTRCLKELKEKYGAVSKLHRERFEQVRSKSHMPPVGSCTDALQNSPRPSNPTHHT